MNVRSQKILCAALVATLLASALAIVAVRQLNRVSFYASQKLQIQRDDLNIEWRQLMAEYSTWRLEHKVEQEVRAQLGLNPPQAEQIQIIELAQRKTQ